MKKPCSEMFCLRNQDITDAKAFFIYFLCRTQVKYIDRYFDIVGRLSALLIGTIAIDMIVTGITRLIAKA